MTDTANTTTSTLDEQLELLSRSIQCDLEVEARNTALARERAFNLNNAGHQSVTTAGRLLVAQTLVKGSEAIRDARAAAMAGHAQRRALAVTELVDFDDDTLSLLTARALVDGAARARPMTAVATALGESVEAEERLNRFAKANEHAFDWTMERIKQQRSNPLSMAWHLMRLKGVPFTPWGSRKRLLVGLWLIDQFNGATGLFEVVTAAHDNGGKVANYLSPAPETVAWLRAAAQRAELRVAEYWPTVCKPKPWDRPFGGGYWTKLTPTLPLVKSRGGPDGREQFAKLKATDLTGVLEAVNAAQDTPWAVNPDVLQLVQQLIDRGHDEPALGVEVDRPLPPRPMEADTDDSVRKSWRKACAIVYRENRKRSGRVLEVERVLLQARQFAKYPAIYFPQQLDFRGRMYSVPGGLNPQGSDLQKSLLRFSEGAPITDERALEWLAIHGANCYGVDKVPFADRWNWVADHLPDIERAVDDPLGEGYDFWSAADSPLCFIAWAFDFVRVIRGGWGTRSFVPVAMDGSCNGIQHFSALLRDEVGGAQVNLIPGEKPADIYAEVAAKTLARVKALAHVSGLDGAYARGWLEVGIDRKVAKRAVMTLPYGCTKFGARDFVEDALREKLSGLAVNPFEGADPSSMRKDGIFDAAKWLTPLMWEAISETVIAARACMDYLQTLAAAVAKHDGVLHWETPDGLPVRQSYRKIASRQVETRFHGKIIKPRLDEETDQLDRNRQKTGIAPNWVHSMDGCALRLFVRTGVANGLRQFALIHDSFGVPAADAELASVCLRSSLVQQYTEADPLGQFREAVIAALPPGEEHELPEPPPRGSLDLGQIMLSPYAFA